jgi:Tol biopolymer transport system component
VYRAEGRSYADGAIVVYSRDTKQQRVLVSDGGSFPQYSPSGHLLYVQSGNLMAVPFDATTLEVTGTPVVVVEGATTFGLSNTGSLVYALNPQSRATLVWVDRQGSVEPLPASPQGYGHPKLSPDGRRILVQIQTGTDRNIWTYDIGRDAMPRLTFEGANFWPLWTPDGQRVLYASNRPKTTWDIVARAADGSGAEEAVLTRPGDQVPRSMSPNGEWLAYTEASTDTSQDIWLFPMRSKGEPRPFARTAALESEPMFSPDSRWLAYVSNESGRSEVYVRPLEGAGKWQVSTDGGVEPRWGPNGREVFYRNGGKMYAVDVSAESAIAVGKAHLLFEGPYSLSQIGSPNYDVSRDGRRFLMLKPEAAAPPPVNIVMNWFDELKRLVPTK